MLRIKGGIKINILIATEYDNGGQMHALFRALNLYTEHEAHLITFKQSYLMYDTDVFDPILNKVEELVKWADFFIIGELLNERMHTEPVLNAIKPNNCIIRAGGSLARQYPQLYVTGIFRSIMKTGAFHDVTITSQIFPMAPTVNICHFNEWPAKRRSKDGNKLKIIFSGTGLKHTEEHSGEFFKAIDKLLEHNENKIEIVNITNTRWREALKIKSTGDICFDQLKIGTYANSSIEGMWYGMPTFCYVSGWCKTIHPEVPVISLKTAEEIIEKVLWYTDDQDRITSDGRKGHNFVYKTHNAEIAVKRWESLIRFVSEEYLK